MKKHIRTKLPRQALSYNTAPTKFNKICLAAIEQFKQNSIMNDPKINKLLKKIDFSISHSPTVFNDQISICRFFPKEGKEPPKIVIYRAPIEIRCNNSKQMFEMILSALEQCLIL